MQSRELTKLFRKYKSDNEIFHDLIQFRVREILIVTTIYDAFILEQEDRLTEQIFGEYYSLSLSTAPRVTNASSGEEALELLDEHHFDMVILTMRINDMTPFELSNNRSVKKMKQSRYFCFCMITLIFSLCMKENRKPIKLIKFLCGTGIPKYFLL